MYAASHRIPEENVPSLLTKIGKLNRRAVKLGVAPIQTEVHPLFVVQGKAQNADRLIDGEDEGQGYNWDEGQGYNWVTVIGEGPKLAGWTFVARYDWERGVDGKTVCFSNSVPGQTIPPDRRAVGSPFCEHCNTIRSRTNTFLLQHESGEYKVVGRSCIADFLGMSLAVAMAGFEWARLIGETVDGESDRYPGVRRVTYYGLDTVLAQTAALVRLDGYRNSQDERGATGSDVHYIFTPPHGRDERARWVAECRRAAVTEGDKVVAAAIVEWIKAQTNGSEWIENLQKLVTLGHCPERRLNLLASAIVGYSRDLVARKDKAPVREEYTGDVGVRSDFNVTVVKTSSFDSQYGGGLRIVMRDPDGRTLLWFSTGSAEVREGWSGVIKGTVKKHEQYNGHKQTILSRVSGLGEEA